MKRPWLWWLAVSLWAATAWTYAFGAEAATGIQFGDVHFNLSQLLLLFAMGAAWGDMRRSNADMAKRMDHLERRLDSMKS